MTCMSLSGVPTLLRTGLAHTIMLYAAWWAPAPSCFGHALASQDAAPAAKAVAPQDKPQPQTQTAPNGKQPTDGAARKPKANDAQSSTALEESMLSSDLAILQRLDKPFAEPQAFEDVPAGTIVKTVRDMTGCVITFDPRALGESGGWEETTVTCAPNTPRAALDAVARAIAGGREDLVVDVASGAVVFTDSVGRRGLLATHRYTIGGLLARLPRAPEDLGDETDYSAFDDFIRSMSADDWDHVGGNLAAVAYAGPVASITATPRLHHELRRAFTDLARDLPAPTLDWGVRIVSFALELTDSEIAAAVGDNTTLDRLVSEGKAFVIAAPRVLAARHQRAEISANADNAAITVSIEPITLNALDQYAVRASCVRAATASTPACDASLLLRAVPGVRAVGVVELPADGRGLRLALEVLGLSETAARDLRGPRKP
jgi:hypothetical protein